MHLKLINNPLCYLTDQIIIREVQLKSCHTLIKKCSFNFFEQCIKEFVVVGRGQHQLQEGGSGDGVLGPVPGRESDCTQVFQFN